MQKRIVFNKGKKYIVNAPCLNDVGPACEVGTLWMQSTDLNWYAVNLTGTSASNNLAPYVNQTPLTWQSVGGQDFGFQLLYCNDNNNVYQAYLSGSAGDVTMSISQTPWPSNADYKPFLFLKSITDGYFYTLSAKSGSIYLYPNPNSRIWADLSPEPVPPVVPTSSATPLSYLPSDQLINYRIGPDLYQNVSLTDFNNLPDLSIITTMVVRTITSITLGDQLTGLLELNLDTNPDLTSVDLSTVPTLTALNVGGSGLTSLDLTGLSSLANLTINNTPITSINVSNQPNLYTLTATNSSLNSLTLGNNPLLSNLEADNCPITTLDISTSCADLQTISLVGCSLNTAAVDSILLNLDNAGLEFGVVDLTGGTNASPTTSTYVDNLTAKNWDVFVN